MRRDYAGGANPAVLTGGFADVTPNPLTITCDDLTGWPTGAVDGSQPFFISVGRGTATEEKILVTQRVGNTLIVNTSLSGQRGADGTAAKSHSSGETVEHVITATDADEANEHVVATAGIHGLPAGHQPVGRQTTQTLTGKTMDGGSNTFTNVPLAASPQTQAALADRYTKAESYSRAEVDAKVAPLPPIGSVVMFAASTAPSGWLKCEGQTVSRTTYAALFAVIGTAYGAGNGSTTFALPNFTGRAPRGAAPGATGGADSVTMTLANMPQHIHDMSHNHPEVNTSSNGSHNHSTKVNSNNTNLGNGGSGWNYLRDRDDAAGSLEGNVMSDEGSHIHTVDIPNYAGNTAASGSPSPTPLDTTTPFVGVSFIIRAA